MPLKSGNASIRDQTQEFLWIAERVKKSLESTHSMEHINSAVLPRKPKKSSGLARMSGSTDGVPHRLFDSSGPDGMLFFIMGMSIGILSAKTASKREVDDMKLQLKQTHNLVQDLHDELNMKEMITVKEIVNEGYNAVNLKMSKIEEELQAELEMLEHNMKLSKLAKCE